MELGYMKLSVGNQSWITHLKDKLQINVLHARLVHFENNYYSLMHYGRIWLLHYLGGSNTRN